MEFKAMTVKELIEALEKIEDKEMEVWLEDYSNPNFRLERVFVDYTAGKPEVILVG